MVEEWKIVEGYENKYWVSNLGKVKSQKGELSAYINGSGYPRVELWKDNERKSYAVHRLVARAFLGEEPFVGATVDHKDRVKANARLDNLRWANWEIQFGNKVLPPRICKNCSQWT